MKYTIELSFVTTKNPFSQTKSHLEQIANLCNSSISYNMHEISNERGNINYNCISSVSFNTREDIELFLNKIKPLKKIHVDCIFQDDESYKLLFASKLYQKQMNKTELKTLFGSTKLNYIRFHYYF